MCCCVCDCLIKILSIIFTGLKVKYQKQDATVFLSLKSTKYRKPTYVRAVQLFLTSPLFQPLGYVLMTLVTQIEKVFLVVLPLLHFHLKEMGLIKSNFQMMFG